MASRLLRRAAAAACTATAIAAAAAAATVATACKAGRDPAPAGRGAPPVAPAVDTVSCFDLPRDDPRSHNLSGLAWDQGEQRLYAVSDKDRWITVLAPRPGFRGFDLAPPIALDIDVEPWDGEALAIAGDRFLVVANETEPAVYSVDRAGHDATRMVLPEFRGIRDNLGIEGIGYIATPEGRYLFAVNEQALEGDGAPSTERSGTVVRILRHSLDGRPDFEAAYLTEPIFADGAPGDNGVSDLAPLSAERVLLVERAYVRGHGNAVRIFAVDLRGAQDVSRLADARAAAPVRKRLVVDLAMIADDGCSTPRMPQRRRTLDNYEGLAVGPTLPDGRRVLFLVSDDNERATQMPRLLTLAIAPDAL